MTEELFREDATLLQCEAQVLAVDEWPDGSRAVVLDRTVFYPLGGGQAGDAGRAGAGRRTRACRWPTRASTRTGPVPSPTCWRRALTQRACFQARA